MILIVLQYSTKINYETKTTLKLAGLGLAACRICPVLLRTTSMAKTNATK